MRGQVNRVTIRRNKDNAFLFEVEGDQCKSFSEDDLKLHLTGVNYLCAGLIRVDVRVGCLVRSFTARITETFTVLEPHMFIQGTGKCVLRCSVYD